MDVGSVSVNCVLLSDGGEVVEESYTRTKGQPALTVFNVLKDLTGRIPKERISTVAVTGSGGKAIAEPLGGVFVNEIVAQAKAVEHLHPDVRTIIEIGGEDSKLILLDFHPSSGLVIEDFSMNTICAAGTGSFLDQQATRLGLSIEEFGELALRSEKPPRIAGRCSVFAKTDMIHLQQEAAADYDIVAGLCYALARNFKSTIGKGKDFRKPISFQGGVAGNKGMVRAFEDVLGLPSGELLIPQYHASMGAIGGALISMEDAEARGFEGVEGLMSHLGKREPARGLPPLSPASQFVESGRREVGHWSWETGHSGKIPAYLGVDVGSISTNVVAVGEDRRLLARRYLLTAGRPIEAVRKGLEEIGAEIGDSIEVRGVATTGSGRYMIGDLIGADVVVNEITAQARASVETNPEVDTIFEIGGQDSKYISIENGAIVDFEMNKVCAAGTGSFLEEQAERLNISIKDEFGRVALSAPNPAPLGERCTVFMESDLVSHQQKGVSSEDLVAGLSYSIVYNYLNRVVGEKKVGDNIFFQGAVAFNQGVVAAFEKVVGKSVTVPPNNDVTGAIGAAILSMERSRGAPSKFKGFDLSKRRYETSSFECQGCPNHCEVRKVTLEGEEPLFYGGRCEKYEQKRSEKGKGLPDLFAEREEMLLTCGETGAEAGKPTAKSEKPRARIGIPRVLLFHELLPLFKTYFSRLGFEVVLSDKTNRKIVHLGVENVTAESCFPIKVTHGHILNLLEKGVDYIFLPSVVNMEKENPKYEHAKNCPYVQSAPYMVRAAIQFGDTKLLSPVFWLQRGEAHLKKVLSELGRTLGCTSRKIGEATADALRAQKDFYFRISKRGEEVLNGLKEDDTALVIVSRPYNGCDSGVNLDIPKKLRELGVLAIPMDFLPLRSVDISDEYPNMYWRYGQRILAASEIIGKDPRLYGLYITNFGCGPDSFITRFFREKMGEKSRLIIEVDEHSADVGAITRCEAFMDSLGKRKGTESLPVIERPPYAVSRGDGRKIFIPYMSDHAYVFRTAFRERGIPAEVLPESDQETLEWGRKLTDGKECYPCIITTGDFVKKIKEDGFDPDGSAFFMLGADGPCRFGQYLKLQRIIMDQLGYENVPFVSLSSKNSYDPGGWGIGFAKKVWQGVVAVDLLEKLRRETRPYEVSTHETDRVYEEYLKEVCEAVARGNPIQVMERAKADFGSIEVKGKGEKPVIGIVGEIFVRANRFANDHVVDQIEELGGEAWSAPVYEWALYTNLTYSWHSKVMKNWGKFLREFLIDKIEKREEHLLLKPLKGLLRNLHEPRTKEVLGLAEPYLHPSFEGEAVLSLGKAIDFARKGLSGVVSVMPFTCLPGTVVSAVSKKVREKYHNIPWLNIAYDGLQRETSRTRLEAFMYQAHQYKERMRKK